MSYLMFVYTCIDRFVGGILFIDKLKVIFHGAQVTLSHTMSNFRFWDHLILRAHFPLIVPCCDVDISYFLFFARNHINLRKLSVTLGILAK